MSFVPLGRFLTALASGSFVGIACAIVTSPIDADFIDPDELHRLLVIQGFAAAAGALTGVCISSFFWTRAETSRVVWSEWRFAQLREA